MAQEFQGTVNVTNGSSAVIGVGTRWLSTVNAGNIFFIDSDSPKTQYIINAVNSDTQIILSTNYTGTTKSGSNYRIARDFTNGFDIPVLAAGDIGTAGIFTRAMTIIDSALLDGNRFNAVDLLANRGMYDNESPGFIFLAEDTNDFYILTSAAGVWNGPFDAAGVGPQGPIGPVGPQGAQGIQGQTGLTGPQGPAGIDGGIQSFIEAQDTPDTYFGSNGYDVYVNGSSLSFRQRLVDARKFASVNILDNTQFTLLSLPVPAGGAVFIEGTIRGSNTNNGEFYGATIFAYCDSSGTIGQNIESIGIAPPSWNIGVDFNSGNFRVRVTGDALWSIRYIDNIEFAIPSLGSLSDGSTGLTV